jgi:hypothetical protein
VTPARDLGRDRSRREASTGLDRGPVLLTRCTDDVTGHRFPARGSHPARARGRAAGGGCGSERGGEVARCVGACRWRREREHSRPCSLPPRRARERIRLPFEADLAWCRPRGHGLRIRFGEVGTSAAYPSKGVAARSRPRLPTLRRGSPRGPDLVRLPFGASPRWSRPSSTPSARLPALVATILRTLSRPYRPAALEVGRYGYRGAGGVLAQRNPT